MLSNKFATFNQYQHLTCLCLVLFAIDLYRTVLNYTEHSIMEIVETVLNYTEHCIMETVETANYITMYAKML